MVVEGNGKKSNRLCNINTLVASLKQWPTFVRYVYCFFLRRVASLTEENKNKLYRLCVCVMFFTEPITCP